MPEGSCVFIECFRPGGAAITISNSGHSFTIIMVILLNTLFLSTYFHFTSATLLVIYCAYEQYCAYIVLFLPLFLQLLICFVEACTKLISLHMQTS